MNRRNLPPILIGSAAALVLALFPSSPGSAADAIVYSDDFEAGVTERWVSGGTNNTWTFKRDPAGNGYLIDSPGGSYLPGTDSHARLVDPLDLSGFTSCRASFSMIIDTELDTDQLQLEASGDAETWSAVRGWSGNSNGQWGIHEATLRGWAGQQRTYLRFRLQSNETDEHEGVSLDDLVVSCSQGPIPSESPSPSPSSGCSATDPCPSGIGLSVGKTSQAIRMSGAVSPPHPGSSVRLKLLRKRNGRFRVLARATVELDGSGRYENAFRRPRRGRCRAKAIWPGDADHERAKAMYRFSC